MEKALVCINIDERQFGSTPQDRVEIFASKNPNKLINRLTERYPRIVAYLINEINGRNGEFFELVRGYGLHDKPIIWTQNSALILPDVIKSSNAVGLVGEKLEEVIETLKGRIADKLTTGYSGRFINGHCSTEPFTNMVRLDTDFRI